MTTYLAAFLLVSKLAGAAPIDFTVSGVVPLLKQPTSNTCWATAATMLRSWKDSASYGIPDVMQKAGPSYTTKFGANQGLAGSEKPAFLSALGLTAEAPQNFTIQGWLQLLKSRGPLWVTTNEGAGQGFSVHARVIKGIFGDGTPAGTFFKVIDPATGAESSESISAFVQKFEDIARADLGNGADLRPQVVHY